METRVISRKEPIEEKSWNWVVNLREHNDSKRIYKIDPFVEVYQLHDHIYSIYAESADGMGDPWIHLIEGEERALLLDTGFGIGNLRGLVEELLGGKPYDVAITHPHPDHAWGCCQFDRVYCHKFAVPVLESQMKSDLWDGLFDEKGEGIWYRCTKNDVIPFKKYEITGCGNHHVLTLGPGHEVEMIYMPGHAPGEMCYLDRKNRILFAGDTILTMRIGVAGPKPGLPYGEYSTVGAFYNELQKLSERISEFDEIYPGHFTLGISPSAVGNVLDTVKVILENPENCDLKGTDPHGKEIMQKKVKNLGTVAYTMASAVPMSHEKSEEAQ